MTIVSHEELEADEWGFSVERVGGKSDGERFHLVRVTFDDGSKQVLWVSNVRSGYFKQVFVPHDFQHASVIVD